MINRIAFVPALVLMAGLTAACQAPATTSVTTRPASSPAPTSATAPLTQRDASLIHARYQRLFTQAGKARGKGMEDAEAGLALRLTRGQLRLAALEKDDTPFPPFKITKAEFTIPRPLPGQSRWFLATLNYAGSSTTTHLIFAETRDGWRVVAATISEASQPLPAPALDRQGLATALGPQARDLVATPRQVVQAHTTLAAKARYDGHIRAILAPGEQTSKMATDIQSERAVLRGQWRLTLAARALPGIYALRTADGGALVWYGMRDTQTLTRSTPLAGSISFSKPNAATLSRHRSFTRRAVIDGAGCYLAVIPSRKSKATTWIAGSMYLTLDIHGS
ncbi:hypothetical protein DP939_42230 [Spongiactinospora rosea]|uniref:DUF8094 domain-containing protein n=1 Tax=Spongiactinospora rosea TaxID=2248750 RepID=A0A366LJX5_9ACTN|nr:hypothetical protein [Spongiactinospora rosea]RBQ14171.1 hypothetical protein DP939_42230 [Spongiactinospora rosea]